MTLYFNDLKDEANFSIPVNYEPKAASEEWEQRNEFRKPLSLTSINYEKALHTLKRKLAVLLRALR